MTRPTGEHDSRPPLWTVVWVCACVGIAGMALVGAISPLHARELLIVGGEVTVGIVAAGVLLWVLDGFMARGL